MLDTRTKQIRLERKTVNHLLNVEGAGFAHRVCGGLVLGIFRDHCRLVDPATEHTYKRARRRLRALAVPPLCRLQVHRWAPRQPVPIILDVRPTSAKAETGRPGRAA